MTSETLAGSALTGDLDFDPIALAIAQHPKDVLMRAFNSTMVGILGSRGSTKSGLCAYMVAQKAKLAARRARKLSEPTRLMVLHNGFLNFGKKISARELLAAMEDDHLWDLLVGGDHIREVILAVDEVQEWFDPIRTASLVHLKLSHLIQQTRKRSVSVIWTTQKPSMIGTRLTDQTDYAIFVESHQRKWRPVRAKQEKYFDITKYAERCVKRADHPHCTDYPMSHTVDIKLVAQDNSPLPAGWTVYGKMYCVQRFYGLWDSSMVISTSELLDMNSETMKAERAFDEMIAVGHLINELVIEGRDRIVSAEFAAILGVRYGIVKDPVQIGKLLGTSWGLDQKRTETKRHYVLDSVSIPELESAPA